MQVMSKYLDFFDKVFYINLDNRIDRKIAFEEQASRLKINAERFSGVIFNDLNYQPPRNYKIGCTLSHQEIIKIAKDNNYENCLIFEDDCIFLDNYIEEIEKCVNDLKYLKWDLFYMGGQPNNYATVLTDNIGKIIDGGVYTTHAYAVNKSFYDTILNINAVDIDVIDTFYTDYEGSKDYLVSKELLAIQSNSFSDIRKIVIDASEWMIRDWKNFITDMW